MSTLTRNPGPPVPPGSPRPPVRRRSGWSRLAARLTTAVLVATIVLVAGIMVMAVFGYRAVVIRSGSMTPALHPGDLVVSRSLSPMGLTRGDVVTFHAPALAGALVTHRVVSIEWVDGVVHIASQGDANRLGEQWTAGADDRVGVAVAHVRWLGWWFALLETGAGRIAMIALACLWVAAVAVPRIWASA